MTPSDPDICPSCRKPEVIFVRFMPYCKVCDRAWNKDWLEAWNAGFRAGKGLENVQLEVKKQKVKS